MVRAISVSRQRQVATRATAASKRLERWIQGELAQRPPRARSLVVTVWGDAIAPHGGQVWLGSLIRLLAPLGLSERLVRTSVYRLVRQGWLAAHRDGRRSRYRLTPSGTQRFEQAYRRIYAPPATDWDGTWDVVFATSALSATKRRDLRRELGWQGFGAMTTGLFFRPAHDSGELDLAALFARLGVRRAVVALRARDGLELPGSSLPALVRNCWDLGQIAAEYQAFLARFSAVIANFQAAGAALPEQSFVVRSLLIHAFRRVTLHDPRLPPALLPKSWPAPRAYALCRDFYRLTQRTAEDHLAATVQIGDGPLPPAAPYFYRRFGGL